MAHAQAENFALNSSGEVFTAIWKMTRAMKTAGWRYKCSSNGLNAKDLTGNPNNDYWGGGVQVGAQTATVAFTIGAPTTTAYGGRSTITGLTGFASTSVGHFLKITGATNGANNGTWLITKFISATSVQIENPAAVAETTPGTATWTELSAMLDTYPPAGVAASGSWLCLQGPSFLKVPIGTTTPTGTFIRGENCTQATSGATGEIIGVLTDTVNGGYLVIAPRASGTGAGVRGWSNTDVITGSVSGATIAPSTTIIEYVHEVVFWYNDIHSGHVYFQCVDSVGEATAAATATTIAAASNGVSLPASEITLASTAGLSPSGQVAIVIGGGTTTVSYASISGNTLIGCQYGSGALATGQAVVQSTGRFSTMASTVIGGADYIHCPGAIAGNNTTSNGFPVVGSFVPVGTGGAGTAATGAGSWFGAGFTNFGTGKAQILAANCIEDVNISADGNIICAMGVQGALTTTIAAGSNGQSLPQATINVASNTGWSANPGVILVTTSLGVQAVSYTTTGANSFTGCSGGSGVMSTGGLVTAGAFIALACLRLDDTEDGEVSPFVWALNNAPSTQYTRPRTGVGSVTTNVFDSMTQSNWASTTGLMGWRRRGMGATPRGDVVESYSEYQSMGIGYYGGPLATNTTSASPDRVACNAATVAVRDPIWAVSLGNGAGFVANKSRKGSCRWWQTVQGNAATDTYDGKQWIQCSSAAPAIVIGPADGTTTPVNQ